MIRIDKVETGSKIRMNHKVYIIDGNTVTRSQGEEVKGKEAAKALNYYRNAVKSNAEEAKTKKVA